MQWDLDGHLTSIIDIEHGRELLPHGELGAVLELAARPPGAIRRMGPRVVDPGPATPVARRASRSRSSSGRTAGRGGRGAPDLRPIDGDGTLRAAGRVVRLDMEIDLDWQHREHLLSMAFPLDVHTDTATCGIQFGHVRRPTHAVDLVGRRQVRGVRAPLCRRGRARLRRRGAERRSVRPRVARRALCVSASPGRQVPRPRRRPRPPRGDARPVPARAGARRRHRRSRTVRDAAARGARRGRRRPPAGRDRRRDRCRDRRGQARRHR